MIHSQNLCNFCKNTSNSLSFCSKCRSVEYCSPECQSKDWKEHKSNCNFPKTAKKSENSQNLTNFLSNEKFSKITKILKTNFINIYRLIYQLNQPESDSFKARNTYYHSKKHPTSEEGNNTCCGSFFSKIYIPKEELSPLERCIAELLAPYEFPLFTKQLLEKLAETFFRIKNQGIKDKLPWDKENEQYVLHEVLREGVQKEFLIEIKKRMLQEQKIDSKQPGLFATPSVWERQHKDIPLDLLKSNTIENLILKGYGFQNDFMSSDFVRALYKELHYLSLEGKFEEMIQEQEVRNDRCLWVTLSEIEKKDFKFLYHLCERLSALPYELNKKNTQLVAQISETCQISYFPENSYHKLHIDSAFEGKLDNGKKITCLYFCNIDPDNKIESAKIRVYNQVLVKGKEDIYEEFDMEWDGLLVMKSRKVGYQILEGKGKRFIVRFWINGPADFIKKEF